MNIDRLASNSFTIGKMMKYENLLVCVHRKESAPVNRGFHYAKFQTNQKRSYINLSSSGYSAWGINDQIIMPREGESLARGGQVRTALRFCFVGLVVRGNYVWCLVIFVIFMGIGGAEVGDALKSSFWGGNASHKSREAISMEKEGWGSHYN